MNFLCPRISKKASKDRKLKFIDMIEDTKVEPHGGKHCIEIRSKVACWDQDIAHILAMD